MAGLKQYLITTKDKKSFVKYLKTIAGRASPETTAIRTLAMRFSTRGEAEQVVLAIGGDYLVEVI